MTTTPKVRGCGTRSKGGIYAELPLGPFGSPVEDFLVDPPIPMNLKAKPLTKVGVTLLERKGITHLLDWIGEVHYPNVADFVEEVREMGLSRRLPATLDFSLLTPKSRILTIHARAHIDNFEHIFGSTDFDTSEHCPKDGHPCDETGKFPREMCAGFWWFDVDEYTEFIRQMPAFTYRVKPRPKGQRRYQPAIFASWPINRIAVINDPESGTHEEALEIADAADLPVVLEDE